MRDLISELHVHVHVQWVLFCTCTCSNKQSYWTNFLHNLYFPLSFPTLLWMQWGYNLLPASNVHVSVLEPPRNEWVRRTCEVHEVYREYSVLCALYSTCILLLRAVQQPTSPPWERRRMGSGGKSRDHPCNCDLRLEHSAVLTRVIVGWLVTNLALVGTGLFHYPYYSYEYCVITR